MRAPRLERAASSPLAPLRRRVLLAFAASLAAALPSVAHADEIDRCLAAHPEAQRLRQDGKLHAARDQLLICARDQCPSVVRAECGTWLGEVDALIPTVVISARTTAHVDVSDARATVDGEPVLQHLDGKELSLDPGTHRVRLEAAGFESAEQVVVLRERERARPLVFTMTAATTAPVEPPRAAATPAHGGDRDARPIPATVYVLGAVGLVGLGSFAYFGLTGRSEYFDLKSRCGPYCTSSDTASMRTKLLVADISLGVSAIAVGLAAYFFFARPVTRRAGAAMTKRAF